MHGIVFVGLKEYVRDEYGQEAWDDLIDRVDPDSRLYTPLRDYPDEELEGFIEAAVDVTGKKEDTIVREFGRYVVSIFLDTYDAYVDEEWSALELVANTEEYIHESLRRNHGNQFSPPRLGSGRLSEDTVYIEYRSDRDLCELAKGIVDGIAEAYDADLQVDETQCMRQGYEHCRILVTDAAYTDAASEEGEPRVVSQ